MKRIVFTRPDGGVEIISPAIGIYEKLTEDEALERARKDIPADAINAVVIEDKHIPTDRSYRNAWVHRGGAVIHDMPMARELHKEKLRALRAPKLADLDTEYQRADEAGDNQAKKRIAASKQVLRDITDHPGIERAETIEDLKKVTLP